MHRISYFQRMNIYFIRPYFSFDSSSVTQLDTMKINVQKIEMEILFNILFVLYLKSEYVFPDNERAIRSRNNVEIRRPVELNENEVMQVSCVH